MLRSAQHQSSVAAAEVALVVGWVLTGLCSSVSAFGGASEGASQATRLSAYVVDLGRHLAFGLASAAVLRACRRLRPGAGWLPLSVLALTSLGVGAFALPPDLDGMASRLSERSPLPASVWLTALIAAIGLSVPIAAWATWPRGSSASAWPRAWSALRWGGVGVGVPACLWLNVSVSPGANPSLHLYLSWLSAVLLGNALAGVRLPPARRPVSKQLVRGAVGALAAYALWGLFGPHSNSVMLQIARRPSALHLVALLSTEVGLTNVQLAVTAHAGPFYQRRTELESIAPPPGMPRVKNPIAIFVSFDSLRADVLAEHPEAVPHLERLRRRGTHFVNARAPGSMTKYTLGSISTSSYFSQQRWSRKHRHHWPYQDERVHVAEVLREAGVLTANFPAAGWMSSRTGLLDGFEVETCDGKPLYGGPKRWTDGSSLTSCLLDVLEESSEKPIFAWVHYLDSHSPFRRGGRRGSVQQRYRRALKFVDSQLGRIVERVEALGLSDRTLLVATSDHGEAFGEHGSKFHGGTLYDELLAVPLVVVGPSVPAREVSVPVSLIDLAPTFLDWFGLPTPGAFMGQSLMAFLEGGERSFQRPIGAETRLKRMLLLSDGYKIIEDVRRKTLEVYDLASDPRELENLSDDGGPDIERRVLMMRSFFQVHRHHPGYRVPYVK